MKYQASSRIVFLLLFSLSLIISSAPAAGQTRCSLHGIVVDDVGNSLPGVKVEVASPSAPSSVVLTDDRGRFSLPSLPPDRYTVSFSLPGFERAVRENIILLPGQESELRIALKPRLGKIAAEVIVTAPRVDIPLKVNPTAASVVGPDVLSAMPRAVGAEEALKTVPGVKVDNQANGERVHLSIRGQGILTERGIRGIQVLLDGIPLNDPSGFAPDLFDVDWATVRRIEVLRGPAAFLYGGGSSGGVFNILTRDGSTAPLAGGLWAAAGSNGFWKATGEVGGTHGSLNFRVSGSRASGDGYRDHTAFWANNLYGKFQWRVSDGFQLKAVLAGTEFFNENAEGLNLTWLAQDRRMANPDANTFNEYQKTQRLTAGLTGRLELASGQDLSFTLYYRRTRYQESVPSSVQHRAMAAPGASLQYNLRLGKKAVRNILSVGADFDWQGFDEYRHPNLGLALEGPERISDQEAHQQKRGMYLLNRLEFGPYWTVLVGLRHDWISNNLSDRMKANGLDLSGSAVFQKTTGQLGLSWNPQPDLSLYANIGQGFLPPATEELYANPEALGGFNRGLVPAASLGEEVGLRGALNNNFSYDLALFHLNTENDFDRYRIAERPLETFYRNEGKSRRYGLETSALWIPWPSLSVRTAYTYSDFIYTRYNSITFQGDYSGNRLPNSPRHQAFLDIEYRIGDHWLVGVSQEYQSRAFVDVTNRTWIDGYLLNYFRVGYEWQGRAFRASVFLSGKNATGTEYIAFTEPDPDGNSYQPGPTREFFIGLRAWF